MLQNLQGGAFEESNQNEIKSYNFSIGYKSFLLLGFLSYGKIKDQAHLIFIAF